MPNALKIGCYVKTFVPLYLFDCMDTDLVMS